MAYTLKDLLDIPKLRRLLDSFDEIHKMPSAVLDIDGTILIATGWQDICLDFHRVHPETRKKCLESDLRILADLNDRMAQTVYNCPMGLVDAAMPIIVGDQHLGNVFTGQFFTAPPDEQFFLEQARRIGFDEKAYLAAVRKVPVFSDEKFRKNLTVLHSITQMLAELGLQTRQQANAEAELIRQNLELANSQKLLKESEERFRALHDASFGGVIIHEQGVILDCNQSLSEITGFSHEELVGMDGLSLIESASLDQVLTNIRSGYKEAYEVEGVRKDGSVYPLAIRGKNVDYFGREVRVIEFRDITAQKKAENALKESEANLRNILMNLPVAIAMSDREQRITFRNKRFVELFGYEEKDVPTIKEWWLRAYPDEKFRKEAEESWSKELKDAISKKKEIHSRELPICCKNGTTRIVEISAILLGKEVLTVFVDVTERKRFEARLQESELHMRELIEQSPIGLVLWKMDGSVATVNSAYSRIIGYSEEEALQLSYWDFTPGAYDREERERLQHLSKNKVFGPYEKEYRHKDGHLVPVRVNSMIVLRDGEPYIWSSVEDITALKIAEQQKAELADQLRQSQKMEAIGTLAGGIAHDFNNILSAILGYTELSLADDNCDDKLRMNLNNVLSAASRAKDLVKQILTYSRKGRQEREPVILSEVVSDAIQLLRKTIPSTVDIEVAVDEKTGTILANTTQIHQIVMNLCTNAFHALPEQGGRIEVNLKPVDIESITAVRHQTLNPGPYACLTVADNGSGIAAEILPLIFDPFFTTKKQGEGTGMGLAVIDGIVRSHEGALEVESSPGNGSVFRVLLPLTEPLIEAESEKVAGAAGLHGSEHVLLVDDEPMLRDLGKEMLVSLGLRVTTASLGMDALALFQADPQAYDMIITDQSMPGLSGFELARQVLQVRPELPVIICTGYSAKLDSDLTRKLGIRAVLMKPFSYAQLSQLIRDIFNEPAASTEKQPTN